MYPVNCFDVYCIYRDCLFSTLPKATAQSRWNKFRTALFRFLLKEIGFKRENYFRKLTKEEIKRAEDFLKGLTVRRLLSFRRLIVQALENLNASASSFATYKSAIEQFAKWGEQEIWWPNNRGANGIAADLTCPPVRSPNGKAKNPPRMTDKGALFRYGLKRHELPKPLQTQVHHLEAFLSEDYFPNRAIDPVESSTEGNYLKATLLYLGWFHHCQGVRLEDLSLNLIFPAFSEDFLDEMEAKQRRRFWRAEKANMQRWIAEYRTFLRVQQQSDNPRTWLGKMEAVLAVGHYQWAEYVEYKADYQQIPLFALIRKELNQAQKDIERWAQNGKYVADQSLKWPEFIPDEETALGVIRRDVVEGLRHQCQLLTGVRSKPRSAHKLASCYQRFLMWVFLAIIMARRQKSLRTSKISLSCPVQRPASVPADGLYHPIAPDTLLRKRRDGSVQENWLCRVYTYQGVSYPDGAWLWVLRDYKTWKTHGDQTLVVPDWPFEEGRSLYTYLQEYLYGCWLPGNYAKSYLYDWAEGDDYQGTRGIWVTPGRSAFQSDREGSSTSKPLNTDICYVNTTHGYWSASHLFLMPVAGGPMGDTDFCDFFARGALSTINKWTTPHLLRAFWATWGFTTLKRDDQLRSLAFSMGMTVETMYKIYVRCTPAVKQQPALDAINHHFLADPDSVVYEDLLDQVLNLSQEEQQKLIKELLLADEE